MQLSVQDLQAGTKAMQQWDGKDYNEIPTLIKQNGGSLNAVLDATQKIVARQQQNATLDETTLKNTQTRADQNRGRLQSIVDADPSQQNSLWDAEITKEEQAGTIKPGAVSHQYPGDDAATYWANHFALGSVLAKEASEQTAAQARATTANTAAAQFQAKTDPNSPLYDPSAAYLAKKAAAGDPEAKSILDTQVQQAGAKAGAEAAAKLPYVGPAAAAEAAGKQPYQLQLEQVRQQVSQSMQITKDARDKIETSVLKPYQDKMAQIGELQSAIDQASQGNIAAARAALYKTIGVAQPAGTHRVAPTEVTGFSGMGSIPQRMAGSIANALSGDPWTPQMVQDIKAFGQSQAATAQDSLNRGIGNINKLYNTNVGGGLVQNTGATGQVSVKAPDGSVHTFPDQASAAKFKQLAGIP